MGVKPDIAVPAADARTAAHVAILRGLLTDAAEAARRTELQEALAKVEAGEVEVPLYTRGR